MFEKSTQHNEGNKLEVGRAVMCFEFGNLCPSFTKYKSFKKLCAWCKERLGPEVRNT